MKKLTQREASILKLVTEGYMNSQISDFTHISIHTVKVHMSSIIKKLNAKNRCNAIYIAVKNNIID